MTPEVYQAYALVKSGASTFGGDSLYVPFSASGSCRGCAGLTSLL